MSDAVVIAMIQFAGSLVAGCVSVVSAIFAYKAMTASKRAEKNTNGVKDELVALTAKASHAEGLKEGVAAASSATELNVLTASSSRAEGIKEGEQNVNAQKLRDFEAR
jgi:hypothetical protein